MFLHQISFLNILTAIILVYNATILWIPRKRANIQVFMTSEGEESYNLSNIDGVIFLFSCFYLIFYVGIMLNKLF